MLTAQIMTKKLCCEDMEKEQGMWHTNSCKGQRRTGLAGLCPFELYGYRMKRQGGIEYVKNRFTKDYYRNLTGT